MQTPSKQVKSITPELSDRTLELTVKIEIDVKHRNCLTTLFSVSSCPTVLHNHQDAFVQPQPVIQAAYDTWLRSPSSSIITIPEQRGTGKDFNARALFQNLRESSCCASYFSFNRGDVRRASATALLGSVILQVLNQEPARFSKVESLYTAIENSQAWTQAGLLILFQSLLNTEGMDSLYLVIDNLHECDSSLQRILDMLLAVFHSDCLPVKLKVIVAYEERQDTQNAMNMFAKFHIANPFLMRNSLKLQRDVLAENLIKDHPYLLPLRVQISNVLKACAGPGELAIAIHVLDGGNGTPRNLRSIADMMMALPPKIADVVCSQFQTLSGWARLAVGWVVYAKRPLRLDELVTALALTDENANFAAPFDLQDLPVDMPAELRSQFGTLLKVDNGMVLFSSEDSKDHFFRLVFEERQISKDDTSGNSPDNGSKITVPDDAQITKILLKYLCWPEFLDQIEENLRKREFVQPQGRLFDLLAYAVQFWHIHFRAAEKLRPHAGGILELLQNTRMIHIWCELKSRLDGVTTPADVCVTDPLLLASHLGLTSVVQTLKESLKSADRDMAIRLASWSGHADVVELLLQNNDRADTCDHLEALRYASARGYDPIVKQLLEHIVSSQHHSTTWLDDLILQAAQLGYEQQISLFLEYGANLNAAIDNVTPLQLSAQNGHASMVYFFLKVAGVDVDAKLGDSCDPPIVLATKGGYLAVVEHLLSFHADITRSDILGHSTPLHIAAKDGHEGILRCLFSHDAASQSKWTRGGEKSSHPEIEAQDGIKVSLIDSRDNSGKTPLMVACVKQRASIVKLLLEQRADATILDDSSHTALYYATHSSEAMAETILNHVDTVGVFEDIGEVFLHAAKYGFVNVVRRLVESPSPAGKVALQEYSDSSGRTALHYAAENGHNEIVRLILVPENANKVDDAGYTPLEDAAMAGEVEVVGTLLLGDADALRKNADDETIVIQVARTPARSAGHKNIVDILLQRGVDPNAMDGLRRTALHYASNQGNLEIVKCLLQHKADLSITSDYLWNALHFAARCLSEGAAEVAELLVDAGVDPLEGDDESWTPLHVAAQYGNIEILEFLWKKHPHSVNAQANDGRTAIHFGYDEPRSLEWLLKHGVDPNTANDHAETALLLAAKRGYEESTRILLDNHADPAARDNRMRTALHNAAMSGYVGIGRKLLKKDKSILCYRDNLHLSALHLAIRQREARFAKMLLDEFYLKTDLEDLNAVSEDGETPLMSAVSHLMPEVADKLLKFGVDTEVRAGHGLTALLLAADWRRRKGDIELIRCLLNNEANHADVNAGGGVYPTALHMAALDGNVTLIRELIAHGANVNAEGGKFNSALSAAAANGFEEAVDLLLEQGADPTLDGGLFSNALSAALFSECYYFVPIFIAKEADPNAKDRQGRTSLHIAAFRGSWEMMEKLRAAGGDPTVKDQQGRTVYHYAATSGLSGLISKFSGDEQLRGLQLEDVDGWTPLHWACRNNANEDNVGVLIEQGANIGKATRDGWTPENIAIFHEADDIATLITEMAAERNESKMTDKDEQSDQVTSSELNSQEPAKSKRWKVGGCHWSVTCDGCFQFVSDSGVHKLGDGLGLTICSPLMGYVGVAETAKTSTFATNATGAQRRRTLATNLRSF